MEPINIAVTVAAIIILIVTCIVFNRKSAKPKKQVWSLRDEFKSLQKMQADLMQEDRECI